MLAEANGSSPFDHLKASIAPWVKGRAQRPAASKTATLLIAGSAYPDWAGRLFGYRGETLNPWLVFENPLWQTASKNDVFVGCLDHGQGHFFCVLSNATAKRTYLLVKRFDRVGSTGRQHVVALGAGRLHTVYTRCRSARHAPAAGCSGLLGLACTA